MLRTLILLLFTGSLILACSNTISPSQQASVEPIHPDIYSKIDDPSDPYRMLYKEFRDRRDRDMANPDRPQRVESVAATHFTRLQPWGDIRTILPFNWSALDKHYPDQVNGLFASVKMRLGLDSPDIKIVQIMLGTGAILPAHADGSPGVYIGVGGHGEVTLEGQTQSMTPGTTVKLNPYDVRRVVAYSKTPLKLLWIRWAPDGDQAYLAAGYYLTGANQHIQPEQANMPLDYKFWGETYYTKPLDRATIATIEGPNEPFITAQIEALEYARAELGNERDLYPSTPTFSHESDYQWLNTESIKKGGFFFSKDAEKMGAVLTKMGDIARHKAIFRAVRKDGQWDYNISETSWGPRSTYVEHSHLTPEFYYIMSGPVIYGVDGERHTVFPGDIIVNNSYSPHLAQGIVDGMPFDNFGSTWAPNGDRSVFDRPFYLLESLPSQTTGARLADKVSFH